MEEPSFYAESMVAVMEIGGTSLGQIETVPEKYLKSAGQVARSRAAFALQRLAKVLREGL